MPKPVKKKPVARPQAKKSAKKPAPKPKAPKPEWASKDDLRLLASKAALGKLAAKSDLASLATKAEVAALPSKKQWMDLDARIAKLEKNSETLDKKIELLASQQGDSPAVLNRLNADVSQVRDALSRLEDKLEQKPTAENEIVNIETRLGDHETRLQNLEGLQ
ncbi:MAG TPA: hypothetical protein VGB38_02820 [bacterium]